MECLGAYMGKIVRVDLTDERITEEAVDEDSLMKYVGGVGIGAKFLYEEVPPGVEWSDPENRMIWASGPLGGTRVSGSGTFCVVTKGSITNLAASSQANGFLGAFLRFSGFDAIILQGVAKRWLLLYIHDGIAELRDASHLLGMDTWETEDALHAELGQRQLSVFSIGPSGEKLVRFACIVGDKGHVAAHNGVGAVMGSKKLKAIAVARGKFAVPLANKDRLGPAAKELIEKSLAVPAYRIIHELGTAGSFPGMYFSGALPVKNYTSNLFPEHEKFSGRYLRTHFGIKRKPCWACRFHHSSMIKVTEGTYAGYEGKEPEYEALAACSSVIGQTDPGAAIMLANLVDRLGLDANECGWVIGWVMECYEKGLLTQKDTDGLQMTWGNAEATAEMLRKIASREGFGGVLAEGMKRAAERIGGEALNCAVYTQKGAVPRGHDHRARWYELIDTCLSNTGTVEVGGARPSSLEQLGIPPETDPFSPEQVSTMNAKLNGRRQFEDCLGVCRFGTQDLQLTVDALNAVTGWNFSKEKAIEVGLRVINMLRVFNLRHGLVRDLEAPSVRYGSAPVDGPAAGITIMPHWDFIVDNYYKHMGWDTSGRPLPETLKRLGLNFLLADLEDIVP